MVLWMAYFQPKILGNRLGILTWILIAMDYYFLFLYFREIPSIKKKKKHLSGKIFGSPHKHNRVYLKWNWFSNYVYLKAMHITLNGIGKNLFIPVLRIWLICKFLNFTVIFTKKALQSTPWKVSIFGVILVRIFPHNSEYGHFLRSKVSMQFSV